MMPPPTAPERIIIRNANVFDGLSDTPFSGDVLITGDRITGVSTSPISVDDDGGKLTEIDAGGRFLMPGMSDAHVHLVGNSSGYDEAILGDDSLIVANTIASSTQMLLRGFTTVRDMGGDTAPLKKVFDRNQFPGPRIFPSQAALSQSAGHGDFSMVYDTAAEFGGARSRAETIGFMRVVDGVEHMLAGVREQLKKGASQIKVMIGGGAASLYDPLYTLQFTPEEIRAAVQAAEDYGTYVATHVYSVAGIHRAIEAGVRSIEHGQLADEETVALIGEKGIWLSTQPFAEHDHNYPDAERAEKNREICSGVDDVYGWARKYGVKLAFGTDLLFEPTGAPRQSVMASRLGNYFSNVDALKILTSGNASLFEMSGDRNPYGAARLGVIDEGAWADVLLFDGNPIEDLSVIAKPDENLALIVKNGVVFKNSLPS